MQKSISPVSPRKAVEAVSNGANIHLHSVACAPRVLIEALCERVLENDLKDITVRHIHTEGDAPYVEEKFEGKINLESYFVGHNVRKATQAGRADYVPVFLCETQKLIEDGIHPVDFAMVQVSPPDKHGMVSLGTSVDCTRAAVEKASTAIAVVNKYMPRAWGDAMMHLDDFDIFVEHDEHLFEAPPAPLSETDIAIGKLVASLVEDGATLQMGIGAIPNAVLAELGNHRRLGVHTEMFADGLIPLVEKGVVTGEDKVLDKGKIVASFLMGSRDLYNFIDDNPMVMMQEVGYTNGIQNIMQNPKVTAINSAIAIDLTGQVCADSIGTKFYSGVGGQVDFMRGAAMSKGGKPITAMPSVTKKGQSKITPTLLEGSGVVTSRPAVHYVVTEYGIAYLYGLTLQKRAKELIKIAHPDHREDLARAARERFGKEIF